MSYVDPYAGRQGYSSRLRKPTYDEPSYDPYSDGQGPSSIQRPTYDDQPPYASNYPQQGGASTQGQGYDVQESYEYGGQPLGPSEEPSMREYQEETYPTMAKEKWVTAFQQKLIFS
jgi:hypothetical protein